MKKLKVFILLAVLLSCSGCIYLRMIEVKNQLRDFEKYFSMSSVEGFALTFKKPTLLKQDVFFILNSQPKSIKKDGEQDVADFLFKKEYSEPRTETQDFDIPAYFYFKNNKNTKIYFKKAFPPTFTENFLTNSFKQLGKAELDQKKFTITALFGSDFVVDKNEIPNCDDFTNLFGQPYKTINDGGYINIIFKYNLVGKTKSKFYLIMDLKFNKDTKKLEVLTGKVEGYRIF